MEGENENTTPKDKNKPITSQVLEYYHQYSQNRALPKYFCGSSSSFKPDEWEKSSKSEDLVEGIKLQCNIIITSPTRDSLPELNNPPSPSSSVASNRKLEWDNGADIGYNNASSNLILQKSISLPVLNTIEQEKLRCAVLRLNPEGYASKTTQVNKGSPPASVSDFDIRKEDKYLSSSTSESLKFSKPEYVSSSSSALRTKSIGSTSSSGTRKSLLKDLMTKIGLPVAESTPIAPITVNSDPENFIYTETPRLGKKIRTKNVIQSSKKSSCEDLSTKDESDKCKVVVLHATKPVVIDLPSSRNKLVQTSLPKNTSVALQTDLSLENRSKVVVDNENVVLDSNSTSDDEVVPPSSTTHTNVTSLSRCSSFEYLSGADYDRMGKTSQQESNNMNKVCSNSENTGHSSTSVPSTSNESPLALLLTSNRSGQCISNLQRNLELLQRVMKSKKYDDVTKKYYLKKITKKMIDASEILDREGLESKSVQTQSVTSPQTSEDKSTNGSRSSSLESSSGSRQSSKSDGNSDRVITKHVSEEVVECSNSDDKPFFTMISKQVQLQAQTFTNEIEPSCSHNANIQPVEVIESENLRLNRSNLLTLTDHNLDSDHLKRGGNGDSPGSSNEIYNVLDPLLPTVTTSTSETATSASSNQTSREETKNWRKDTTRSEQQREKREDESKEHLLDYAKKERQQQLGWIKNEITHLSKLKELLEKKSGSQNKKTSRTALQKILQKPIIEDMGGIKKATTVYILTTEKSEKLSEKTKKENSCNCNSQNSEQGPSLVGCGITSDNRASLRSAQAIVDQGRTSIRRYTFDIHVDPCEDSSRSQSHDRASNVNKVKPTTGSSSCTCCCTGARSVVEHYTFDLPSKGTGSKQNEQRSKSAGSDNLSPKLLKNAKTCSCSSGGSTTVEAKSKLLKNDKTYFCDSGVNTTVEAKSKFMRESRAPEKKPDKSVRDTYTITSEQTTSKCSSNQTARSRSPIDFQTNSEINTCECGKKQNITETEERWTEEMMDALRKAMKQSGKEVKFCSCGSLEGIRPRNGEGTKQFAKEKETNRTSNSKSNSCQRLRPELVSSYDIPSQIPYPELAAETTQTADDKTVQAAECYSSPKLATETTQTANDNKPVQAAKSYPRSELADETTQTADDKAVQVAKYCPCKKLAAEATQTVNNKATETLESCPSSQPTTRAAVDDNKVRQSKPTSSGATQTLEYGLGKKSTTETQTEETRISDNTAENTCICVSSDTTPSTSTLANNSSTTYSDEESQFCECCKKSNVTPKQTPLVVQDEKYILCSPCYDVNQRANYCGPKPLFSKPEHVCKCYVQGATVQQMRATIEELEDLECREDYCRHEMAKSSKYCPRCKCKVKQKYNASKGGLAYLLTLESDDKLNVKEDVKQMRFLKEIKVKVPSSSYSRRTSHKSCVDDCKCCQSDYNKNEKRKHQKHNSREFTKPDKKNKRGSDNPSLQDYLCANKPNFVTSAEERRKCLLDLAYMREQRCQKYKQLLALTNGVQPPSSDYQKKVLFSCDEMKKITEKNYKKLPEVQQKLLDERDKKIKKANKMLADIFNHKLRQQTLKGKVTLPTTASIIKF